MNITSYLLSQDLAGLLITMTVQAILISLLGFTAVNLLSKMSAPVRSLVCAGAIAALGLVLVVSIGFRLFNIAWTQPTIPVFLEENKANSMLFSRPDRFPPVETISPTDPALSQIPIEKDIPNADPATPRYSHQFASILIFITNFLGIVWFMGFLFQLLRLVYGVILVKKFRDSLPGIPDNSFNEMVRSIAGAFWKNRMPELYSSSKIESPITIGLLNPVVIIPEKLFNTLSENELKSILLHELAHIYHYDQVIGVIKRIVLAAHWWNPLVYIINREHEQAREDVSDNYVLRELHPRVFTRCLTDLAEKVCLINNFPTTVGMAGRCFSLPVRVEHILSKKRNVSMNTKFYLKTVTFAVSLVFVFGIAGLNGKVKPEDSADIILKKQEKGYTLSPVSLFKEEPEILQKKDSGFEMIEKQDKDNTGVISNTGVALPAESSYKPVLKNISSASAVEHARIQTAENPEKKTESVIAGREPAIDTDAEDSVLPAQNESPMKASSDAADVPKTRGIELKNEDAAAYISRGVSCLKKGQIENAISDFNKAIDIDPRDAVAYIARGSAYYKLNRFDNALTDYNRAIEINPYSAVAYQNRGSVYYRLGQFDDALTDYNRAIEINPEFAASYQDRGSAYYIKGSYDNAIYDFSKVLELDHGNAGAYTYRGAAYFLQGKYEKALIDFNRAIKLNPRYANAYINRGACYNAIKKYDKAVADYIKATELNPEPAFVRILMKYRSYETASFLIRILNNPSYTENTMTLRYMQY